MHTNKQLEEPKVETKNSIHKAKVYKGTLHIGLMLEAYYRNSNFQQQRDMIFCLLFLKWY